MADEKVNVSPEESKTLEAPATSGPGDPPAPEHTEGPAVPGGDQAAPFMRSLRSLPRHSVDMLLTDPPYGTTRNGRSSRTARSCFSRSAPMTRCWGPPTCPCSAMSGF